MEYKIGEYIVIKNVSGEDITIYEGIISELRNCTYSCHNSCSEHQRRGRKLIIKTTDGIKHTCPDFINSDWRIEVVNSGCIINKVSEV